MTVRWTASAQSQLVRLPHDQARRIVQKVDWFALQDAPLHFAVPIQGQQHGSYRFRVGHYRVFFEVDHVAWALVIVAVHKRDQAYRF